MIRPIGHPFLGSNSLSLLILTVIKIIMTRDMVNNRTITDVLLKPKTHLYNLFAHGAQLTYLYDPTIITSYKSFTQMY